jgi:hypothetical protein
LTAARAEVEVVEQMNPEVVRERQQTMLATAAAERQALLVHALARATRRAERAQRRLVRSRHEAMQLRGALAAEEGC